MPTTTKQPLDEMTADELQTQLESTQKQIAADTEEYSTLQARMVEAAEQGESETWQKLHALHATLPTKITGQKLRALSIQILLKQSRLEEAQAAKVTTGAPLAELRAKADAAAKELEEATFANQDAYHHANDTARDLAALTHARADLQAAAKPTMPQSKPILRAAPRGTNEL
jgi:chromosome segregation ATPase